jgi:hypothetical protein
MAMMHTAITRTLRKATLVMATRSGAVPRISREPLRLFQEARKQCGGVGHGGDDHDAGRR